MIKNARVMDDAEALLNLRTTLTARSEWPETARWYVHGCASVATHHGRDARLPDAASTRDQGPGGGCFA